MRRQLRSLSQEVLANAITPEQGRMELEGHAKELGRTTPAAKVGFGPQPQSTYGTSLPRSDKGANDGASTPSPGENTGIGTIWSPLDPDGSQPSKINTAPRFNAGIGSLYGGVWDPATAMAFGTGITNLPAPEVSAWVPPQFGATTSAGKTGESVASLFGPDPKVGAAFNDELTGGGGGPSFGPYGPDKPGWHWYMVGPNEVCPAYLACTPAQAANFRATFQVPGTQVRTIGGNSYSVYDSRRNGTGAYAGDVRVDEFNNGLTGRNTTQPGHLFHDGQIVRTISQGEDGAWYMTTIGYGNNPNSAYNEMNKLLGPAVFHDLDMQMYQHIVTTLDPFYQPAEP